MGLVNSKNILQKALKNKYAVGAFNVYNLETAQAVVETCEKKGTDAIIAVSEGAIKYTGLKNIVSLIKSLTKDTKQEYSLHLDHGSSFDSIKTAIEAGFTSVMIDGSNLSFEDNISLTKRVVEFAHKHNVSVEAELGKILSLEELRKNNYSYTNPEEAKIFVEKTNVDSLAISIGTAHGINKGNKKHGINFDVINEISLAIPNTPLVAHGSSTVNPYFVEKINKYGGIIDKAIGIPKQTIEKMSKTNICKINVDTDIRLAFTAGIREYLTEKNQDFDPRKYLSLAKEYVCIQIENTLEMIQ